MSLFLAVFILLPLSAQTVMIRNVRVFDGERVLPRTSVLAHGGVIRAVGANLQAPAEAEVVDGEGKTLLPGLIDAHTHTARASELKEALAFGVTTEFDLFSLPATIASLRAVQRSGAAKDMADVRFAGICATVPGGHGTEYNVPIPTLSKPEEAQTYVDDRLTEGSDYLKVIYTAGYLGSPRTRPNLNRETMAAIIQAAHRRGRLAVVHVDTPQLTREAIEAGADVLAHLYVAPSADPTIATLARQHKVAIIPTLSVRANTCGYNSGPALASDPLLAPYLTESSKRSLTLTRSTLPWLKCDGIRPALMDLRRAGVPLLTGSDTPNAGTAHGVSVHSEVALLVDAGLTPVEALKAATSAPADAFRLRDRGRVAPGQRADLVLVDGDPTTDIRTTRRIVAVWKQGWRLNRDAYRAGVATLDAPLVPDGVQAGRISDFDDGTVRTSFGPSWQAFEGVQMKLVANGAQGSPGALAVSGEVKPDRPAYVWPGIVFTPSGLRRVPVNLSSKSGLQFWAKGDGRNYRVVIVGSDGLQEKVFQPGPGWQKYRFAFADFGNLDPQRVQSVILASSGDPGPFEIQLDEISFY